MARSDGPLGLNTTLITVLQAIAVIVAVLALAAAAPAYAQNGSLAITDPGPGDIDVSVSPQVSGDGSAVIVTRRANCVKGKFVMNSDGELAYAVPMIGPEVLRGSIDAGPATALKTVGLDQMNQGDANSIVSCFGAPR